MISRVLIVGGGIAGTTAAIALAQHGIACSIAELQSEWQATGVGIGLQSPPLRATKALGLFDRIVAIARQHPEIVVADAPHGGRELPAVVPLGAAGRTAEPRCAEAVGSHLRQAGRTILILRP